ncbi:hypothetical protein GSY71_07980 [Pusillimonas sp. TS35]|nr:hypothetical protein [Pusillimonas sp. TS35]
MDLNRAFAFRMAVRRAVQPEAAEAGGTALNAKVANHIIHIQTQQKR